MDKKQSRQDKKTKSKKDKKRYTYLVSVLFAILIGVLLYIRENPIHYSTEAAVDYFKAKEQFAEKLSKALSKDQTKYRIAAINGPEYQPGYVVDPDNPVDLLTDKCLLNPEILVISKWAPLPEANFQNQITIDISTSGKITQYAGEIAAIGGKIKKKENGIFKIIDLHQILAPSIEFKEALAGAECQGAIEGKDVVVVRGQILGKEYMSTHRDIGTEVETKLIGARSLVLNVNHQGDFSIEDKEPIPRFHIVTSMSGSTRGSISERLVRPTDEQIKKLESVGTK